MLTNGVVAILGILLMLAAFFTTGMRGAFSSGPYGPITKTGRAILFVGGLLVFLTGLRRLLK